MNKELFKKEKTHDIYRIVQYNKYAIQHFTHAIEAIENRWYAN